VYKGNYELIDGLGDGGSNSGGVFTFGMLSRRKNHPEFSERVQILLHEQIENLLAKGGTEGYFASIKNTLSGEPAYYSILLQNALPLTDSRAMGRCLKPCHSEGKGGVQGSGAVSAALLQASHPSKFFYAFHSRTISQGPKTVGCWFDPNESNRLIIGDVSEDWNPYLESMFGEYQENGVDYKMFNSKKMNVAYIVMYDPEDLPRSKKHVGMPSWSCLSDFGYKVPGKLDNLDLRYTAEGQVIGEDNTKDGTSFLNFQDLRSKSSVRGSTCPPLMSEARRVKALREKEWNFRATNLSIKSGNKLIGFNFSFRPEAYHAIKTDRHKHHVGNPEFVLETEIDENGEEKRVNSQRTIGAGMREMQTPKNFVFVSCENKLEGNWCRFAEHPVYMANRRVAGSISLQLGLNVDAKPTFKNDLGNFPEYMRIVGLGSENPETCDISKWVRAPYLMYHIGIEITSVKVHNRNSNEYIPAPLDTLEAITAMGGCTEFFTVENRDVPREMIDVGIAGVLEQCDLSSLRDWVVKAFPSSQTEFPELPLDFEEDEPITTGEHLYDFVVDGEPQNKIGYEGGPLPSSISCGKILDHNGNDPIPDAAKAGCYFAKGKGHTLSYDETTGFSASVTGLGYKDENGFHRLSEEEFSNHDGRTLPRRHIWLHRPDVVKPIRLSMKVVTPAKNWNRHPQPPIGTDEEGDGSVISTRKNRRGTSSQMWREFKDKPMAKVVFNSNPFSVYFNLTEPSVRYLATTEPMWQMLLHNLWKDLGTHGQPVLHAMNMLEPLRAKYESEDFIKEQYGDIDTFLLNETVVNCLWEKYKNTDGHRNGRGIENLIVWRTEHDPVDETPEELPDEVE
jgi:hypothetical protein